MHRKIIIPMPKVFWVDNISLDCPYGDVDTDTCEALMNDTTGPGNCYSLTHSQECCETCPNYYNASNVGMYSTSMQLFIDSWSLPAFSKII